MGFCHLGPGHLVVVRVEDGIVRQRFRFGRSHGADDRVGDPFQRFGDPFEVALILAGTARSMTGRIVTVPWQVAHRTSVWGAPASDLMTMVASPVRTDCAGFRWV